MFKGLWVGLRLFWCSPSKSRAGLIAISAALWLAFPAKPWLMAQTQGVATLRVRIDGARNARGEIVVLVFRDSNGFTNDGSKAVRTERVPIDAQTLSSQAVFEGFGRVFMRSPYSTTKTGMESWTRISCEFQRKVMASRIIRRSASGRPRSTRQSSRSIRPNARLKSD